MTHHEQTDEQLMAAMGAGEMSALGQLVQRHQEKVLSLAYRLLGRWDAAEDVGQEAFLRVQRAAASYRPTAKFSTWLYRIVSNLCLDEWRRMKKSPPTGAHYPEGISNGSSPSPSGALEKQETVHRVWEALGKLPPRERLVVVLHRFHAQSHREVAAATGWSEAAVESLLVRAYRKLRKELADLQENEL